MKRRISLALTLALVSLGAVAPGARGQQRVGGADVQRLPAPGKGWALELSLPGFVIGQNQLSADGQTRKLSAGIEAEGYIVTVMLARAPHPADSKFLRDLAAERARAETRLPKSDFRSSDYRQTPTLEYLVREYRGQPINQKHFHAYVSRDDVWIDIHFSKTSFREGDERLFRSVLDTIRFTDVSAAPTRPF